MPVRARAVVLLAASLAACAGAPRSASSGADEGERLYRSKCSACHRPYAPEERTRAEWARVLPRMAPRAHLGEAEVATLLGWLQAHAKDARTAPSGAEGAR